MDVTAPATTDVFVVVVLALGTALLAAVVVLGFHVVKLRRQVRTVFPEGEKDVVEVLVRHAQEIAAVRDDLAKVHGNTKRLREHLQQVVSRVGVVRYDAFDDVGGAQSFSAALLDGNGDGIVISAINGRHETRCYGKEVMDGRSVHTLSEEEVEAIRSAIEGRPVATLPRPPRRGRRVS